jgi:hypothetical protein
MGKLRKLEQREPINLIMKYFKFYGIWNYTSIKHRVIALITFIILQLSCCILVILSFANIRDISDFTRCMIYTSIYTISCASAINIYVKQNEIQELFDEMSEIFNENMEHGIKRCNRMYNITIRLTFVILTAGNVIGPLINGRLDVPFYMLSDFDELFYVIWPLQASSMFYTIFLSVLSVELMCNLLIIMHTYVQSFQTKLKDLKGDNELEIIECIRMHLNIKR